MRHPDDGVDGHVADHMDQPASPSLTGADQPI
jgi:hypothetical protein